MISVEEAENELSNLLERKKLCIFAGSGISVMKPSSLPTWDGFVNKYKKICEDVSRMYGTKNEYEEIFNDVKKFKKRERDMITTVTALKDIVVSCIGDGLSMNYFNMKVSELFSNRKFNSYHNAIVNTDYQYILTTNYDNLLGSAADASGFINLLRRVYTHKEIERISEAIYCKEPAIIHMHGCFNHLNVEDFILTKEDYKRIKDKNPGFRHIMNSIFMNYSILLVGYGSSDPHLEDIIDDLNLSLNWINSDDKIELPSYYLLIKKEKLSPIFDHVKGINRTKVVPFDKHDDMLELLQRLQAKFPRK
jgi:NAD-dependent SIR2 family protein deacetylase